jgi:ABC-type transport system involved in multi-copper enzyme maturation permease subunit
MYRTLMAKEIREHLMSARFALAVLLCLAGFGLNALALKARFVAKSRDYVLTYELYNSKMANCSPVQSMPFFVKPPAPTMVLFQEPAIPQSRADPPLPVLFRTMDYSLCASLLLSLIAMLLSFDAISGEREKGTLRILLIGGVSRARILVCKFAAVLLMTVLPFLLSTGVGLLIVWPGGTSLFSPRDWIALAGVMIGGVCYIAVFTGLGLVTSVACRSSGTSLLTSLLVWVSAAVIVPNVAPEVYGCVRKTPSAWSVQQEHAVASKKQTEERDKHSERFFRENPNGDWLNYIVNDSSFFNGMKRSIVEDAVIDADHNRAVADRMNAAYALARVSPFTSMVSLSQTLSHTGVLEFQAYTQFVQAYLAGYVDVWRSAMQRGPIRSRDMRQELPAAIYNYLPLSRRVENSLPDFALLIGWAALLFVAAYGLWSRREEV